MFFDNLKENYDKLSISEQQVIDFLMKQSNIEKITLKEIKQEVLVSSSTVIRACKKLGYSTFNDLKYDIRLNKDLEKNSDSTSVSNFNQLKEQLTIEFNRTMSILNQEDFEDFADEIVNARRIFCVGSGSSYMVMADFNRKLKLIDLWSNDYFEAHSIKRIPDISTNKDVIITFSLGGASKDVNDSLLLAKKNGTKILTVTSLSSSPLARMSDKIINVYDAPKTRKKIRSRLMLNVVGILLFETIVDKMSKKIQPSK